MSGDYKNDSQYIWYEDLKWNQTMLVKPSTNPRATSVELSLSDGQKVQFIFDDIQKLRSIINKLEASV